MTDRDSAITAIRAALQDSELDWVESVEGVFDVVLPGERKLTTPCRLDVGEHALSLIHI